MSDAERQQMMERGMGPYEAAPTDERINVALRRGIDGLLDAMAEAEKRGPCLDRWRFVASREASREIRTWKDGNGRYVYDWHPDGDASHFRVLGMRCVRTNDPAMAGRLVLEVVPGSRRADRRSRDEAREAMGYPPMGVNP